MGYLSSDLILAGASGAVGTSIIGLIATSEAGVNGTSNIPKHCGTYFSIFCVHRK